MHLREFILTILVVNATSAAANAGVLEQLTASDDLEIFRDLGALYAAAHVCDLYGVVLNPDAVALQREAYAAYGEGKQNWFDLTQAYDGDTGAACRALTEVSPAMIAK